ncbi:hypothetical protein [Haloglomus irregulare]|jgi:hypothetical protein|uniref:hypothetical protein n=1 Tax=Haloglomus irregulare TaxID=2234134 RepID=UPI001186D08D|nr:hypothetical protein [Haloglomus irregulare]
MEDNQTAEDVKRRRLWLAAFILGLVLMFYSPQPGGAIGGALFLISMPAMAVYSLRLSSVDDKQRAKKERKEEKKRKESEIDRVIKEVPGMSSSGLDMANKHISAEKFRHKHLEILPYLSNDENILAVQNGSLYTGKGSKKRRETVCLTDKRIIFGEQDLKLDDISKGIFYDSGLIGPIGYSLLRTSEGAEMYYRLDRRELNNLLKKHSDIKLIEENFYIPALPGSQDAKLILPGVTTTSGQISIQGQTKGKSRGDFFESYKQETEMHGEFKEEEDEFESMIKKIYVDSEKLLLKAPGPSGDIAEFSIDFDIIDRAIYIENGFQVWSDVGQYRIKLSDHIEPDYIRNMVDFINRGGQESSGTSEEKGKKVDESSEDGIKNKLQELDNLHESDLISSEEYERKRQNIIEDY